MSRRAGSAGFTRHPKRKKTDNLCLKWRMQKQKRKLLLISFCQPYHWLIYLQCLDWFSVFGHIFWIPCPNKKCNGHYFVRRIQVIFKVCPISWNRLKRILASLVLRKVLIEIVLTVGTYWKRKYFLWNQKVKIRAFENKKIM